MKLKYERFEGLGCLYVRGQVDEKFGKLLQIGIETIAKDLEETLVINLTLAKIDPLQIALLAEFKKKANELTKQKLYWISKDRGIGDFATIDIFISRMSGAKSRQIGERIKADDQSFEVLAQIQALQAKIKELGGDEDNVIKLINENASLKEQRRILESFGRFQNIRSKLQVLQPSQDKDTPQKINEGLELIKTYFGREIDL